MTTPSNRPQPLRTIAIDVAAVRGAWMTIITTLVSAGIIGLGTGNALASLAGLIPGACALIATLLGAHGVAVTGEPLVTPISDPAISIDGRLVLLTPATPPPAEPHP